MVALRQYTSVAIILYVSSTTYASCLPNEIGLDDIQLWSGAEATSSSFVFVHEAGDTSPETCKQLMQAEILAATLGRGDPPINVGTLPLTREVEEKLPRKLRVSFSVLPAWVSIVRHSQSPLPHISTYDQGTSLHDVASYWMRMIKNLQPASLNVMLLEPSTASALLTSTHQTALLGFINSTLCSKFDIVQRLSSVGTAFAGEPRTVVGLVDLGARRQGGAFSSAASTTDPPSLVLASQKNEIRDVSHIPFQSGAVELLAVLNEATHAHRLLDGSMSTLAGRCEELDSIVVGFSSLDIPTMRKVEQDLDALRAESEANLNNDSTACRHALELYMSIIRSCMRMRNPAHCVGQEKERTVRKVGTLSPGTAQHATQTRRLNVLRVLAMRPDQRRLIAQEWAAASAPRQPQAIGDTPHAAPQAARDEL